MQIPSETRTWHDKNMQLGLYSRKTVQFSRPSPPTPLFIYIQNSSTPLTLDVQFQTNPLSLQMITNQLKEAIIQGWLLHVIRSFLQVSFCFQYQLINLSWLSFDSFSFSWNLTICIFVACLYSYVTCLYSKNITKHLLFIIIHIFSSHFAISLFYFHNLKT